MTKDYRRTTMAKTVQPYLSRLQSAPLVFDGAMGTMFYGKGVFINACFEELNLTRPSLVEEVHLEYVNAGADAVETNTFGANRLKLQAFGLADKVKAINQAAVVLARAAAGAEVYVAGSLGPLGPSLEPYGRLDRNRAREIFREQALALAEAGVDLFLLETFRSLDELLLAVEVCREVSPVPIQAHFTVNEEGEGFFGHSVGGMVGALDAAEAVSVVGVNCGAGPSLLLSVLETMRPFTQKPLAVMPNAGLPQQVDGRTIYMSTPEYMAEYAKRMVDLGAAVVGGCCGTAPSHIKGIAAAIHAVHRPRARAEIRNFCEPKEEAPVPAVPAAGKSRLAAKISGGEFVSLVEITPPHGCSLEATIAKARQCRERRVDAINIPDGPRASARLSPMVMALEVERQTGVETVLHYCCRDRNLISMQADLLGAFAGGLRNILLVTGDPPKLGNYPDATAVFDVDSVGLTRIAANLNRGRDLAGIPIKPATAFYVGVGANPAAVDLRREAERFQMKKESGAEFAITQPVFSADALERFLEMVKGCPLPVISGIWPLASYKNAEFLNNEVPGVSIPKAIMERMAKTDTKENARLEGIAIAHEIIEKIRPFVAGLQVSAPFGNVETAFAVLGEGGTPRSA